MAKKSTIKKSKQRVDRPRGAGTYTEASFWSMIRSALRNQSRWWKPIALTKIKARRAYKGLNKRRKYEYQCNICKQWFSGDNVSVDHILPVGSLNCAADLPGFVERLFVEDSELQCLCTSCHNQKTSQENSRIIS